jgi:hypothetical protein
MPKLLLFAPCEKVLQDATGPVSLISVVEKIEARVPAGVDLPRALPFRMQTVAIWNLEQSEVGQYETMTELAAAGAKPSLQTEATILGRGGAGAKIFVPLDLIPAIEGRLEFRVSYRKIGDPEWILATTYPIELSLVRL